MFMLSANESHLVEIDELVEEEVECVEEIITRDTPSSISMHAFEEHLNPTTIRLTGFVKSQAVSILVDSSSTHNFM